MRPPVDVFRRLLKRLVLGAALIPLAEGPMPKAFGADAPLITADEASGLKRPVGVAPGQRRRLDCAG
jgi:hypothetical protein